VVTTKKIGDDFHYTYEIDNDDFTDTNTKRLSYPKGTKTKIFNTQSKGQLNGKLKKDHTSHIVGDDQQNKKVLDTPENFVPHSGHINNRSEKKVDQKAKKLSRRLSKQFPGKKVTVEFTLQEMDVNDKGRAGSSRKKAIVKVDGKPHYKVDSEVVSNEPIERTEKDKDVDIPKGKTTDLIQKKKNSKKSGKKTGKSN